MAERSRPAAPVDVVIFCASPGATEEAQTRQEKRVIPLRTIQPARCEIALVRVGNLSRGSAHQIGPDAILTDCSRFKLAASAGDRQPDRDSGRARAVELLPQ